MEMKNMLIGLDDATRCPVIGSLYLAIVAVTPRQRMKYKSLPIKDSKRLSYAQIERIFKLTNKDIYYRIYQIPATVIDEALAREDWNLNDECMFGNVRLINEVPEFWTHKIFIDNCEHNRESWLERMKKVCELHSSGLHKAWDKLNTERWVIEHGADDKHWACSLASIYAKYHSIKEYEQIRAVYGDFGSGNPCDEKTIQFLIDNPDNPHIRKSWVTYKRLVEDGRIKR